MLQERKVYSTQVRPCSFQPENLTGYGSEGVNRYPAPVDPGRKNGGSLCREPTAIVISRYVLCLLH